MTERTYKPNTDRDELDKLVNNLSEHEINNMLNIINIYITLTSLEEIKKRIADEKLADMTHEFQMRGLAEFQNFLWDKLKKLV